MNKDRLTALTDGIIAVIITIMVLEMKPPAGTDAAALLHLWPVFLSYVLSFVYVAIYWNNHHHFFHMVVEVKGGVLWANMHLLFWVSLIPFTTAWLGAHPAAALPTAAYGAVLLAAAIGWYIMQAAIIRLQGPGSPLKRALGRDSKGKAAPFLYLAGIGLAFVSTIAADAVFVLVACLWLIPDRRVESALGRA